MLVWGICVRSSRSSRHSLSVWLYVFLNDIPNLVRVTMTPKQHDVAVCVCICEFASKRSKVKVTGFENGLPCAALFLFVIMPPPYGGGIKRCFFFWRLSVRRLSHTSGLTREPRGLGRLKLAQRYPTSYVTRTPVPRSKGQRSTCRWCLK